MNEVNEAQTSVQQKINEVSKDMNDATNSVQQSWNNDPPRNFNDTSEDMIYGYDGTYNEAPYDYREATQNPVPDAPAVNTDNKQLINTIPDPRVSDPESPYFDPSQA
jgi:hypothetical protein